MLSALVALLLAAPTVPGTATTLTFRWPDHLRCEVERRTQMNSGPTPRGDTVDRYQLEASRERGAWVIRRTYLGGIDRRSAGESASRRELKADRLLSYRVRANGGFAGVLVDAETRERLRTREREWRAQFGASSVGAALAKGVPYPGSEKQLEGMARGEWTDLVEGWIGATLQAGVPVTRSARREFPLPALGPTRVQVRERWQLVGSVPCHQGGPASCVELEWVTEPDLTSINRAMAASQRELERAGGDADGRGAGMSRFEVRKTLVTDPLTLIPARLTKRMEIEAKGEEKAFTQEEITSFACTPAQQNHGPGLQAP